MGDFRDFIESQWSSFGRQKEFPFMYEPGFNRKATSYLDKDTIDPEEEDDRYNLYHVTTNLSGVKAAGRLKSRAELGTVGLGGGVANEAPHAVSVTYDINKAHEIYDDLVFVAQIVNGQITASQVWDFAVDRVNNDDYDIEVLTQQVKWFLPPNAYKKFKRDEDSEVLLNKYIKTPEKVYEFFQDIEKAIIELDLDHETVYNQRATGFTGSFEDMRRLVPQQIAIIQVVARKGAKASQVNLEKELRFNPEDLKIIRYYQP